jgi:tetratricopeptide (TPR) repeat protein
LFCLLSWVGLANGQGFGKFKKTITLERKLPAVVQLPGDTFNVKVTASEAKNAAIAGELRAVVETELGRYNARLLLSPKNPATVISLRILNVDVPQPVPITSSTTPLSYGKKNTASEPPRPDAYKVTGRFEVAYQARTPSGKFIDANNIDARFAQEYNSQGTKIDEGVDAVKKGFSRIKHLGKSSDDEAEEPQSVEDVEQILMSKVTALIAARLVSTNETVEIPLARGSALDDANKYAEAQQWSKWAETLETMQPWPDEKEDAYRFYNLGVAYEALGYAAQTPDDAKRDLEDAAADYGKATEMNPAEKRFLPAQDRIELALEHYEKLASPPPPAPKNGSKAKSRKASKSTGTGTSEL